jgi:fatty-acyl-CoA synthase
MYNCPEYLEGMVAASKARTVSFNVNYRYVDEELTYLFRDAKPGAIIFGSSFAPQLARVLEKVGRPKLLLQIDDGGGEALLPGARAYEEALAGAPATPLTTTPHGDDLYMLYTGGTTGAPKGVLWRQHDIFFAAMGGRMPGAPPVSGMEELLERVTTSGGMIRMLPAPPFMHGAAHWSAFMTLHQGGTVCLPGEVRKLDAHDMLSTIERERVMQLTIVGDAFARPLIDQLRTRSYDLSGLRIIGSGGAILSPPLKEALLDLVPDAMVVDGFGASETGAQGATVSMRGIKIDSSFRMDDSTVLLDEGLGRRLDPGEQGLGWVARAGHVPLGYLGDEAKTKRTYPTVGGVRYSVPGDRAEYGPDGMMKVHGRDSVCINTGGEKVFAEEVEQALKRHPAVYDVVVAGVPDPRWGESVTAVVALRPGATVDPETLKATAAEVLARYKLPKIIVFVDAVVRAPSGKPDYRWAKATAAAAAASSTK